MVKLLSPISSYEAAIGVISAGADEIYFGVRIPRTRYEGLSTRTEDCSLSTYSDLRRVTGYAHDRGVKTILTTEFPFMAKAIEKEIERHVSSCIGGGIDALIASDIGVLLMVRDMGIDIPVYASTYLASMNYEAVDLLRKLGVKRVILERQLAMEEIRKIVQRSEGVEIEVFVHGPGCSNINANCYGCTRWQYRFLKAGSSTGRRALPVAGPMCCQWFEIYEVHGSSRKRVTSAPILDAYSFCSLCQLPDLVETGATGFKIVGRCGTQLYQEHTTRVYRELVDLIEQGHMDSFQKKLESIRRGKNGITKHHLFLVPGTCRQKRCYYSPFFHAPYKIAI